MQTDRVEGMTLETSAALLGVHEFSLYSRVQSGEIKAVRSRSGEITLPASELERLLPKGVEISVPMLEASHYSDESLGIERTLGRLKQQGKHPVHFCVPGYNHPLRATEIESYRCSFGAISSRLESIADIKVKLEHSSDPSGGPSEVITTMDGSLWHVCSKLLALGQSEVVLCQGEDGSCAIVEHFSESAAFSKVSGTSQVLIEGADPSSLVQAFKSNALHTLEFMASDAVAKAQKVAWEQFPDDRPGHVVAAISERCHRTISNDESITRSVGIPQSVGHGNRQ